MKQQFKKWTLRILMTGLFITGLLLIIILNPNLTYANKTIHNNFTIYHNDKLDPAITQHLDRAEDLLKRSEFYNHKLTFDICINDGSTYPNIIKAIRGQAFAWGFYDKVVLQGTMNCKENYVELHGYKWNLTQLLAHEMTHCLQFDQFGFWKSKPMANIENWKWEGYAEFIARHDSNQQNLVENLLRLQNSNKQSWSITFDDGTIAPMDYYQAWTMVQYCILVKQMKYQHLLSDTVKEQIIEQEMNNWYKRKL